MTDRDRTIVTYPASGVNPPSMIFSAEGKCAVCGLHEDAHKVVWFAELDAAFLDQAGLRSCMYETGFGDHGVWYRYVCRPVGDPAEDTMDREEFEEMYSDG
jgi:hypothetical protein